MPNLTTSFSALATPYKWILGHSNNHCPECLTLAGQVRTLNHWINTTTPGSTQCGHLCHCKLIATTQQPTLYPGDNILNSTRNNFNWSDGKGSNDVEDPEPIVTQPTNPHPIPMQAV